MENKSMSNILSQAKQVETQLVNQQERLSNKEAQLHMQVQKMHEEVGCLLRLVKPLAGPEPTFLKNIFWSC